MFNPALVIAKTKKYSSHPKDFVHVSYSTLLTTIYIFYNIVMRRPSRPVPRFPSRRVFFGRRHSPSTLRQFRVMLRNI
ncbi:hypothetical protein T4C_13473 [Trichinella pseudospiralis]|uniref:Uncharacterized protein n=1 Tax=Trichinella pseudospiralis TaxID=6337 RepID=A0A0V1K2J8_TRIPS|nr:hypothetical protein T4C_13473 [Trichinella pseudospiralis]